MSFERQRSEQVEDEPLDISERVKEALFITDAAAKRRSLRQVLKAIKGVPEVVLTLDYTNIADARWVKSYFLEGGSSEQKRMASLRATDEQRKEAINVFASGVRWIEVKK